MRWWVSVGLCKEWGKAYVVPLLLLPIKGIHCSVGTVARVGLCRTVLDRSAAEAGNFALRNRHIWRRVRDVALKAIHVDCSKRNEREKIRMWIMYALCSEPSFPPKLCCQKNAQIHFPLGQAGIFAGTAIWLNLVHTHVLMVLNMTKSSGWTSLTLLLYAIPNPHPAASDAFEAWKAVVGRPGHGLLPSWVSPPTMSLNREVALCSQAISIGAFPPAGSSNTASSGGGMPRWPCYYERNGDEYE